MNFRLKSAVWEITLACCFSCKYCGSHGGKARENELNTEECLTVVKQLSDLGCERVSMIGGEVFMRRDWREIVKALINEDIKVSIITNGFLFDSDLISDIKSLGVESIAVSLDGPKAVHDKYRQEGSFDRAIRAIEAFTAAQVPVSVISTLNRENVEYLEEFYGLLEAYDIFAWQLQACSPMGNAAKSGIDYAFDANKVIDFVRVRAPLAPFSLGIAHNIGYFTSDDRFLRGNRYGGEGFRGCTAGLECIGIDSVGNIRGCESMYDERFIEGNIREKALSDIWNNPDGFPYNRGFKASIATGKCAKCENLKYCAGGCRSYNYFVHGRLYESPICVTKADRGKSICCSFDING